MFRLNLSTVLLVWVTWVFFISNILIAYTSSDISTIILIIRDAWMPLIIYLSLTKDKSLFIVLVISLSIGAAPILWDELDFKFISYFYGARDLLLLAYIILYSNYDYSRYQTKLLDSFLLLILILSGLQLILQIFNVDLSIWFRTKEYFASKGVSSELGFGVLGPRLSVPFYSPNILATYLVTNLFFSSNQGFAKKIIKAVISAFTLSKVWLVGFVARTLGKYTLVLSLVGLLLLWVFYELILALINNPILTYHFNSTIGHLLSFETFALKFQQPLIPSLLGRNSTLILNLTNQHDGSIIESTLISRALDLKVMFLPILVIFIRRIFRKSKAFGSFIFITLLLTATSNHPVCWTKRK